MSSDIVIEAKGLVKKYDEKKVVDNIHFLIKKGECFGVLGPNGAGKTSTMKMMYCSAEITQGELFVAGYNVKNNSREIKARIGVVPQEDGLDPDFTVLDNLLVYSGYHGLKKHVAKEKSLELLRFVRLEEYADRHVETLSGGMKRRLVIARSLLNKPEVLFLDEPTTGLDPQARVWIWDFLSSLKKEGVTLVLTTHYMEEAEYLCDSLAIMDHGKILTTGTPKDLITNNIGNEVVEFEVKASDISYYTNRVHTAGYDYQAIKNRICVFVKEGQEGRQVMDLISSPSVTVRKPGLNDVFLKLAGYELRD